MNKEMKDITADRIFVIAFTIVAVIVFMWILSTLVANADASWAEQMTELRQFADANCANMMQGK